MPYNAAFKSKFRIVDNAKQQQKNPDKNLPPNKLAMDLSLVAAERMSAWLLDKIEEAKRDQTTIREYKDQSNYEEIPGFTMWGAMYGKSGNFSPPVIETGEAL